MKHFSLLFTLICLCSCSDNVNTQLSQDFSKDFNTTFVSEDSAVIIANQAISALEEASLTRSCDTPKNRKIKSVTTVYLNEANTRSNSRETTSPFYFINYKDNQGFVIVSGDKRLQPIYAISDQGTLNIKDTLNNKGLALFMEGIKRDSQRASKKPTIFTSYKDVNCILYPQVAPLIWAKAREWGQLSPFNNYCFTQSGEQALVGCAPVACGLIMSYYSWPETINNESILWRPMKKGSTDLAAKLFYILGKKQLLNTKYGTKASVSHIDSIRSTFKAMGYMTPNKFKLFSSNDIKEILDNALKGLQGNTGQGPVLIAGSTGSDAHIWVIDGYAENPVYESDGSTYKATLFHCIWGNNKGLNNGYFALSNNQLGGKSYLFDINDAGTNNVDEICYYSGLLYMTNFKKSPNVENGNVTVK